MFGSAKKTIITIVSILIAIIVYFIFANQITPNTNDAHIQAYVIQVTPQISGKISEIYVKNNQIVKKGDALLQIEKKPYEFELQKATSDLLAAKDQVEQLKAQIRYTEAVISQREIDLKTAQAHYNEFSVLANKGVISKSQMLNETQKVIDARALLEQSQQNLIAAQKNLGPNENNVNIHIKIAQTAYDTAQLNLLHTTVVAAENGAITNLNTLPGDFATPGTTTMALVSNHDWWVQANFQENNLNSIRPGKTVIIALSMYPGHLFKGKVIGIGNGISLSDNPPNKYLPYIQKTEDWIKLAQRFPVEIAFDHLSNNYPLRVGATARVVVLTDHGFFWNALAIFWEYLFSLLDFL